MEHRTSNFLLEAGALLLVLFIDGMGLGLVIPILNGLIFDPQSTFLDHVTQIPHIQNIIYGVVIGIFMLCWFFGAAVLGDLSDQIGRKRALIICLFGGFISYVLSAIAVHYTSLSLLLLGRVIAGFTSGSQPIAQAAIVDLSTEDTKARNIGYILLALSLGFIFGPLLGGILADPDIVPWFNFATPFYFAASISLLNIIILYVYFHETFVSKSTTLKIRPYQAINIFISAFNHKKVRALSILFFIFIFGWSSFYSFISLYLIQIYNFTPTLVSIYMAVMGVGFGIGNGFIVNYVAKRYSLRNSYIAGSLISALAILIMVLANVQVLDWILVVILACAVATAYSCILTLFSNQVDANSQGWVMGITGSIMAFVWAVNGIAIGILAAYSANYPLYTAAFCLFIAAIATYIFYKPSFEATAIHPVNDATT